MDPTEVSRLIASGLVLVRVDRTTWDELEDTRRRGARFTLNFRHSVARPARARSLALVVVRGAPLRIGVIRSRQGTSSLDTRVSFDFVDEISPRSLSALLRDATTPPLKSASRRLSASEDAIEIVSHPLRQAMIERIALDEANWPVLRRILAWLGARGRVENAVVMQHDAVHLALNAFGGGGEAEELDISGPTALGAVRVLEDAAIEHDARWLAGWRMEKSDLTGRAVFTRHDGRLEILTANRRPLERIFGVDLIYLNVARGALVMVQYKMLERDAERGGEWLVRIDRQFDDELERMRAFDLDLDPDGAYQLNAGVFFLKLMRRNAAASAAGFVLSLGHLDHLMRGGELSGRRGGLRIDQQRLDGHYLRGEAFVELVRSGYVGSRGATTEHLRTLVEATLSHGRAVVAAIQHGAG